MHGFAGMDTRIFARPGDPDYPWATAEEMRAKIGPNWVVARRTPRMVARYGEDAVFLSRKRYEIIQRDIIAARRAQ